jgi:hypothetical protein
LSRLLFFLLLLAALALGAHLWLSSQVEVADYMLREKNRDAIKLVAVTPPTVAAVRNEEMRKAMQSLAGAACVEFSGITPADATRAHDAFAAMQLGNRLIERRVEEITRHWVFIPPAIDRRSAEATFADLKKRGVSDVSMRPDNAISLGVFSTEEAARRFLASMEAKGVKNAQEGPFAKELREMVMVVREPDSELVSRLTLLQRDYAGSQLRAVPCPTT